MSHSIPSIDTAGRQARKPAQVANAFDFGAPAELFPSRSRKGRAHFTYRRFETAAEAVRFAIEDMPAAALLGAYLEVNEARFGEREIRDLYDSPAYPLARPAKAG
jgi:hypothetical protein